MADKKAAIPRDKVTTLEPAEISKEEGSRSQTKPKSKALKRKESLEATQTPVTTEFGELVIDASAKKIRKKTYSPESSEQSPSEDDPWYLQIEDDDTTHPIRASEILKKESKKLQELQKIALQSVSNSTMQTVITGITAMEAKGYNLKADDWRRHRQEVLRATSSLVDDQAIAQRNQSIPDVNWLQVELALFSGSSNPSPHLAGIMNLNDLKALRNEAFFSAIFALFSDEQVQTGPDLAMKLKSMNLKYMAKKTPTDGSRFVFDLIKLMMDMNIISTNNLMEASAYMDAHPIISEACLRTMRDRLKNANIHGRPAVNETERAEVKEIEVLWAGFHTRLTGWESQCKAANIHTNFIDWVRQFVMQVYECAKVREQAFQHGYFTRPEKFHGKETDNSAAHSAPAKQKKGTGNKETKHKQSEGTSATKATASADQKPKSEPRQCEGCGKSHPNGLSLREIREGTTLSGCQFHRHPDFNKSGKPWDKSPVGIAVQAAGAKSLSHSGKLVNGTWTWTAAKKVTGLINPTELISGLNININPLSDITRINPEAVPIPYQTPSAGFKNKDSVPIGVPAQNLTAEETITPDVNFDFELKINLIKSSSIFVLPSVTCKITLNNVTKKR